MFVGGGSFRGCKIGDNVYIGNNTSACFADIGPFTCISDNVVIGGMEHSYWFYSINPKLNSHVVFGRRTRIGCDVWIGANVVIRQGIVVGDGAVIGAGAVVTHDVPENCVVIGAPARVIKNRMTEEKWQRVKQSHYFECKLNMARTIICQLEEEENRH